MVRQSKSCIVLLAVFFLLLLLPLPQAAAAGGVRNVTKGLSYDTILEAVNAADDGDTIEVAAGTYAETNTIVIDKPLTLRGAAGAVAVIDGNLTLDVVISVESPGVTLEGLTIIGAVDTSVIVDFDAAGFSAETSTRRFSLLGCTLEGNNQTYSAIDLHGTIDHAEITICGNTIRNFTVCGFQSYTAYEFVDSTVKVEDNDFEDAGYGIDLDIPASNTDIFVIGNTVTAEYDAIYLDGILEGSSVTIKDNTLSSLDESIYVGENIDGSTVIIEGNNITSEEVGIYFSNSIDGSTVIIEGNNITFEKEGIYFSDSIDGSTVIIEGNNITSEEEGIYFSDFIDGSTVIIEGNNITSEEYAGVYFSYMISESILSFSGNTLFAENEYDCGLYFKSSLFKCSVTFTDNVITAWDGVVFDRNLEETDLTMEGNQITATCCGFYFYDHYDSTTILKNNSFIMQPDGFSAGRAVRIGCQSNSGISLLGNHFTGALTAVNIYGEGTGSEITIAGNFFKENETGIFLAWEDQIDLTIAFNAFINNEDDILFEGLIAPAALLNWWGAAAGPTGLNKNIAFNPWLAALMVTPDQAAGVEGESCTITAKLQDSNGALAETNLLTVRFTVTGAHNLTQTVPLVNGVATLQYTGNPAGVDTITAEVLFAGEAAGLGGQAQRTWEAKPVTPPEESKPVKPLPPTSGQAGSRPGFGLMLLLTAIAAFLYSRRTAAAK